MNEIDSQDAGGAAVPQGSEATPVERAPVGVDLATRPEAEWLNKVEGELDDTDLVLKCLARDSAKICQTCDAAQSAGELDGRPMLARCASTKQPR